MSGYKGIHKNLFYSDDHKQWQAASLYLTRENLKINTADNSIKLDSETIKLLKLKHWPNDKTVISLSGENDRVFFFGGEKERITSLFLKLTHILSQKQHPPLMPSDNDTDEGNEWLGRIMMALMKSLEETKGKSEVAELLENIGSLEGKKRILNRKKGSIRGAVAEVVDVLGPVCKLKMHSINVTEKKIAADFEIHDCLIKNIHRSNKLDYPSPLCKTMAGLVRSTIRTLSDAKNIEYEEWRSNIEDKCFSKLTVHLPDHYNDEACDRKFWKG